MIAITHKNSQRLTHLINDLLDMEKLAADKMQFDMHPQALMPIIEQALEENRIYYSERGVWPWCPPMQCPMSRCRWMPSAFCRC
jgi:signal transduction histidine kinase